MLNNGNYVCTMKLRSHCNLKKANIGANHRMTSVTKA